MDKMTIMQRNLQKEKESAGWARKIVRFSAKSALQKFWDMLSFDSCYTECVRGVRSSVIPRLADGFPMRPTAPSPCRSSACGSNKTILY